MNLLDRIVSHPKSIFGQQGIRIIRYADDFVLMGSHQSESVKNKLKELLERLYRYYNRKSQRRSRLYRQQAFEKLVQRYGLIDPTKFQKRLIVKASEER